MSGRPKIRPGQPFAGLGFVYVIEGGGLFKIGYSAQPRQRLQSLQCSSPVPLTLLGVVEGTREDEAQWHHRFRNQRSHGEWFELGSGDIDLVLREVAFDQAGPADEWHIA